jgi:hypothetical protein
VSQWVAGAQIFEMLLVIPLYPEDCFSLNEYMILFITVSVVGIILKPVNFQGNAFLNNEIASPFTA